MAQSTRPDRRVQAQAAVDRAMRGELIKLRSYALMHNNGRHLIGVPPEAPSNLPAAKGDDIPVYADFQNGFVVFDFAPDMEMEVADGDEC